jgi:hypothetical protein
MGRSHPKSSGCSNEQSVHVKFKSYIVELEDDPQRQIFSEDSDLG